MTSSSRPVLLVRILLAVIIGGPAGDHCALVSPPRNTVAVAGQPVTITCRSNTTTASWSYVDAVSKSLQPIKYGDISVNNFDLVFANVLTSNAGTYTCQEAASNLADGRAAWLTIVTAANPNCTSKISNTGNATTTLTCTVNFYGVTNIVPMAYWTDNCSLSSTVVQQSTTAVSTSFYLFTSQVNISSTDVDAMVTCSFNVYFSTVGAASPLDTRSPVFVGNKWTYNSVQTITTSTPGNSPTTTVLSAANNPVHASDTTVANNGNQGNAFYSSAVITPASAMSSTASGYQGNASNSYAPPVTAAYRSSGSAPATCRLTSLLILSFLSLLTVVVLQ